MAVLLSYHGKEESEAALKTAIQMARLLDQQLVILVASRMSADDERTEMDAQERLWNSLQHADVPFQVRNASADRMIADSVLDTAEDVDAKLIVLGLRIGGSRVTNVGINASKILLDAPCPVITTTQFVFGGRA